MYFIKFQMIRKIIIINLKNKSKLIIKIYKGVGSNIKLNRRNQDSAVINDNFSTVFASRNYKYFNI